MKNAVIAAAMSRGGDREAEARVIRDALGEYLVNQGYLDSRTGPRLVKYPAVAETPSARTEETAHHAVYENVPVIPPKPPAPKKPHAAAAKARHHKSHAAAPHPAKKLKK